MDEIVMTSKAGSVVRRVRYEQVTHGVHAVRGSVSDLRRQCGAIQLALPPEAVFSHDTGARLRGWQLPWLPDWLPTFASLPRGATHVKRRDLYVARTDEASVGGDARDGVRVAAPSAILAQLAQDLSLLDLVAVVDCALHTGDCTLGDLEASLRPGQWGGTRLRRALELADGRAESWWETPLRLLHQWAGIEVVPQYEVRDVRGSLVARGDLWIVGTRRLHEDDGAITTGPRRVESISGGTRRWPGSTGSGTATSAPTSPAGPTASFATPRRRSGRCTIPADCVVGGPRSLGRPSAGAGERGWPAGWRGTTGADCGVPASVGAKLQSPGRVGAISHQHSVRPRPQPSHRSAEPES